MRLLSSSAFAIAFAALAVSLSTVGCAADDSASDPTSDESDVKAKPEVTATDADDGKTIKVTEGSLFTLKLGANATTGYEWKVTKTDRTFAYPSVSDYLAPPAHGPVGAGGTQVFKWSTDAVSDAHGTPVMTKVGKHEVVVEYRRSWEPATKPAAKTFKITVEVVAKDANTDPTESACGKCSAGSSCQMCWGAPACVPNGALC